jgi:regulator of nucleoside diphosphate kinase
MTSSNDPRNDRLSRIIAEVSFKAISGMRTRCLVVFGARDALQVVARRKLQTENREKRAIVMARRKIIITENDHERLEALLASEFATAIGASEYLDDLRAELDRAEIVRPEDVPRNVVTMNSTVVLRDLDTKEKETYTLVFPEAADIANDRLSVLAPVGTAILGERVGDVVRWRVPQGWRRLKVERVVYQPEREGAFHT